MNKKIISLVILATIISLVIAHLAQAQNQTAKLADGTVVSLEGITFGKERQFGGRTIVPVNMAFNRAEDTTRDAVILWIKGVRPATGPTAHWGLQPGSIRIYDESGKEYPGCEQYIETRYLPHNEHAIVLYSWPRRTSEIRVEVGYGMRSVKADTVQFHVRNRLDSKAMPFTPAPLPISRGDADLAVTLDSIRPARPVMSWSGPIEMQERLSRGHNLLANATFTYVFRGKSDANWQPTDSIVTDSVGNPYHSTASSLYQPSRTALSYYRSDTGEPVKLGVWFNRTANASFSPHETILMNNLPMKLGSYLYVPGAAGQADGIRVEISKIGEVECVGMRTQVTLNVFGGDPHLSLFLRVENQQGRFANGIGPNEKSKWIAGSIRAPERYRDEEKANAGPHQCVDFVLDLPRGTTRINCTVAANKAHYFEFIPRPDAVQER